MSNPARCTDCGTRLSTEGSLFDLCPRCLVRLGLEDSPISAGGDAPVSEVPTESLQRDVGALLKPGRVLGQRYRIQAFLGRGGMGEVWQAFDLKLRVDVALKSLRREIFQDARALEILRREVRSAREVVSPNVCRIFDLVEVEGHELVSMEYIDGRTLIDVLRSRSPMDLREATEISAQFLAGLEAIHSAALIHRDVKPENIMLTRSGRAVLMDFGLARPDSAGGGTVAGTPAYMAPEQTRGEQLDARADIFAAGVVLAEMTCPEGIRDRESRQNTQRGIREDPPRLPDNPWRPVLRRAVAQHAARRYQSARELTRALEEVTLRVEGAEDLHPYPGLAAFTEQDAEYFFGRELEIESMWKKLRRPHLLGLIGPSGAGKSSFIRAGLIPAMPAGWRYVLCQPGDAPVKALARALVPELAGDTEAMSEMVRFDDPDVAVSLFARWRRQHDEVLVVVDQFEELFTLNPPEIQTRVAELLSRLALEADAHVLISMRDDFLFHCSDQSALAPIFSELTPLRRPAGAALRRAVVQPALKCGYRFEEDALVDEFLSEVAEERGALPMLAFAAARLWERRDRDNGLLPREAYEEVGGVQGALAQHAEATLERIGSDRVPVVRELFRNLATAEGTRAARDRRELLSVFEEQQRNVAEEALDTLIDARLLTSYEVPAAEGEKAGHQRVEIIHESLLSAWPRLVRWQTQDADGAQLRDQLRQAAQMWQDRDHSDDLLWSGTAYREFQLWRERYPGGLTATEEAFAHAMTEHARRRSRRRRIAVAATFVVLLGVLAVVLTLWRQSERSEQQAILEARRAEAATLHSLGQVELENSPTAAVAYALRSLELFDNPELRRFALKALWRGPTAIRFMDTMAFNAQFAADGHWLLAGGSPRADVSEQELRLWSVSGGPPATVLELPTVEPPLIVDGVPALGARADLIATYPAYLPGWIRLRSIPDLMPIHEWLFEGAARPFFVGSDEDLVVVEGRDSGFRLWSWSLDRGEPIPLGELAAPTTFDMPNFTESCVVDPGGKWVAYAIGRELRLAPLDNLDHKAGRVVGRHDKSIAAVAFDAKGSRIASMVKEKEMRVWSLDGALIRSLPAETFFRHRFNATGSMLANNTERGYELWELEAPPGADPVELRLSGAGEQQFNSVDFHPHGRWIVTTDQGGGAIWPLARPYPHVLRGHDKEILHIAVAPDGRHVVSCSFDGTIRRWPLSPSAGTHVEILFRSTDLVDHVESLAFDPSGRYVLASHKQQVIRVIPIDGGPIGERSITETEDKFRYDARLDRRGRFAVWPREGKLRILNLESDEIGDLGAADPDTTLVSEVVSAPDGQVLIAAGGYLREWNLESGTSRVFFEPAGETGVIMFDLTRDGHGLLTCDGPISETRACSEPPVYHDLQSGESWELSSHGGEILDLALDPSGERVVTASLDGTARVGPVTEDHSHLLLGHDGLVRSVRVTPDGRWVVTGGKDRTVRLWPMPEGQPFHTLPYNDLLERLRALTNLRVVKDANSPTGYALSTDPFPGWAKVPTW